MGTQEDRVILVTGSSSGIGEAVARAFAAEGGKVVVNSARSVAAGEALAAELPPAVYVEGDIAHEGQDWGAIHEAYSRLAPLGRVGQPQDIAEVCLFLASASFVTGQVIVADAGATLRPAT